MASLNGSEKKTLLELVAEHQKAKDDAFALKVKELEESRKAALNVPQNQPLFNRKTVSPGILEQQKSLPIHDFKDELIEAIKDNQMVIVIGDTGSGKSTQIPQYLAEAGLHGNGKIAVTQPRRVAAKSLATRVAEECGVELGTSVGYAVRFDKEISGETVIKYMTDGLLVKECTSEKNLDTYSIIIIDEAHERSIHTDVCFGLLKRAARERPDLKIIISSATLDEDKFSKYFNNAPVIKVGGKTYPVDVIYRPPPQDDYMQEAANVIMSINWSEPKGDILVFLCGQDEIEQVWDKIANCNGLHIVPCYGALPFEEQQKIFDDTPVNHRKVVLATNIAETSLTIDGIVYVIDCGYFKQNEYNSKTGIYTLVKKRITKFQVIQRSGRAGRTQPGKCYRLYRELDQNFMLESTVPEVTRCNVESVILDIMAMGITDPFKFDFMDKPATGTIDNTMMLLLQLSALDANLQLTPLGKRMSELPLDPQLAKIVIESVKLGCTKEVVKIVALLSTQYQNMFSRSKQLRQAADRVRAGIQSKDGDLLTLLKIFDLWVSSSYSKEWCDRMYLNYRILCEADDIRQQLEDILSSRGLYTGGIDKPSNFASGSATLSEKIRKAFTAGYFRQIARKMARGYAYETQGNGNDQLVYVHPTSALFSVKPCPSWVIYHEVMKTSKAFIKGVTPIELSWVKEYAPAFGAELQKMDDLSLCLLEI